ncbi:protein-disulfide reductase DsbD family protein [Rhodoferax sp.]|uniref:protein-disulfide reductase DsbD family protein n=1 Tax=Rhodoferax sp. TaxID=50421 RepID=UPI00272FFB44|nr:thioredoxin family protein [Rhodoferax sp.]MDP1528142.1 protein-disulfide reductase DsbD family protein [Rhodoferax sp.]MDP1943150.1 protein-disulfide reductase DsbD family protein [Rhodoferax sp.]MDP2443169.1 protein-disulfide reductase DsbD family protein [Rhodoferax sp.]MDP3191200.1 protein-disulfide reductase DsbD family protein [Rhodoferax sp.]MDP3336529.1 protein-disulfide reductase DsbD family protein [Rhodoferax sp.]
MTLLKHLTRPFSALFFLASLALPTAAMAQNSPKNTFTTEQVQAELMAHAPDGVDPGKTVWVGLQLQHQPDWHTYWKNSGDSGLATSLSWTLPAGVLAGDIAWPLPVKIPIGNLANYGYKDTVLLPVPLTITPDFKPSVLNPELEIKLQASWLVCKLECVPQDGDFVLRIPVKGSTAIHGAAFDAAFKAQPEALPQAGSVAIENRTLKVSVIGLPASLQGQTLEFFPETPEIIETAAKWKQSWQGAVWTAAVPMAKHRSSDPTVMPLVLVAQLGKEQVGFVTQAKVTGTWPAQAAPSEVAATTPGPPLAPPSNLPSSLWLALLGALLGGMILNLMPCVFPVLAIKVVGFARHSTNQRRQRVGGLAYSAGVVLSFVALGALMLALRGAGEQLGWGFQLQSPGVVAALAVLFTVIGLNLAGLFEFGQFVPSSVAALEAKNPSVDAFLSGILAVVIASPCTAPFMGASLGLALALPATQALAIFATLGLGMALPYLAASWSPALARLLPRPGAWMATFRHAMAFPMFATVVWLLWVLGQQSGINGAASLLALLLSLAWVIWALGLRGRSRLVLATLSMAALAFLAGSIGQNIIKPLESNSTTASTALWQPWAPGKVDQALASGAPVFVDFTAAWCVTCQYNKTTTLASAELLADFAARNVTLLRADWTRRDPTITAALAQLGRNGVPVYVLYQNGRAPVVLSEILSVAEVRSALARL